MYYEIVPVEWEAGSVHWSSAWYGQPCHQVQYTDGRKLCIYCANEKPDNAQFVFTPNWFQTFQCKWECLPGFMGPGCELSTGLMVSIGAGVVGVLCVSFIVALFVSVWKTNTRKVELHPPPVLVPEIQKHSTKAAAPRINDVISFKEEGMHEIRIKLL